MSAEPTKSAYEILELTDAQKQTVRENYKLPIGKLTVLVFPGAKPDGRTTEGRSIQAYITQIGEKTTTSATPTGNVLELTPDQKAMIDALIKDGRVKSSIEMAKLVYPNVTVKNLSREWRVVYAYAKEHFPDSFNVTEEPVTEAQYTPPDRMQALIGIVNGFVMTGDVNRKTYNPNALKVSDERNLKALMAYMRVYRFKYVASTYEKQVDRDLFISTFIRWAHNKSDLTEMEVDQMISAASETVNIAQMEREIQDIKRHQEAIMSGEVLNADGTQRRFGMTDVEMINGVRTKHDQAKGRLKTLMEGLEEARSKRLTQREGRNASVLNMFEAWMNDPDWRADMIGIGNREKQEDRDEVVRLKDMDDLIALISGMSEAEGGA